MPAALLDCGDFTAVLNRASILSFTSRGRLLVTPGCYEFVPG